MSGDMTIAELYGLDCDASEQIVDQGSKIVVPQLGELPVVKGKFSSLSKKLQLFVAGCARICKPKALYLLDGSAEEHKEILDELVEKGIMKKLTAYKNNYLCRTDPADVARVESKTFLTTRDRYESVPHVKDGVKGILGQWLDPDTIKKELDSRMYGCMAGRVMYVIPFSMGPIGGPLSKNGVEITDSPYVVLNMPLMTRVSYKVFDAIGDKEFVKCLHSIGAPLPNDRKLINNWPCYPEKTIISHFPPERKVVSFGSGYGGNSLLGKKCFALRIAGCIARDEGWMAEHMLIMGVTNPEGKEIYIAAAFPSACGKTNMAMLEPRLPGWKVQTVGDDIAWMRFNDKGELRAINPEAGFFGVGPGTNMKTNPNAMRTLQCNSFFTNTAETANGEFYWEGLEDEIKDKNVEITTWLGEKFKIGNPGKAAHPNSRFTAPAAQCPTIHPRWEDPEGVPISAIIFGGRRPEGVPLIFESFSWQHGVMVGASVKSEATAAAEFKGKQVMHDPMAMRPFMGYNFGRYLQHWLDMEKAGRQMPKIFHVNWFRTDKNGKFLWPGFCDNIRVVDWIMKRVNGEPCAVESAIGYLPAKGSINMSGLTEPVNWDELFSLPKDYWQEDAVETKQFLEDQVGSDMPKVVAEELAKQEERINKM